MTNHIHLFINGKPVSAHSGEHMENINPATNTLLAHVDVANQTDLDHAVESARIGFEKWRNYTGVERGRILYRIHQQLRHHKKELALMETRDTGKPIQESESADIDMGADCFEYYAGLAPTLSGEHMSFPNHFAYTRREPLGICAGIGAWNYPLQIACWKIAPALACGNAMIYKPSELTPSTANALAEIVLEAGCPPGVLNIIHGPAKTGALLSQHPGIAKISLTGSVETGHAIMRDSASTLKVLTMELGGKSPLLVFPDAKIKNAVQAAILGNFYTQGEICTNCTRVFVHESIYDQFLEQLIAATTRLKIGMPENPETQVGSLISKAHQQKVLSYIEMAKQAGATLALGGTIPEDSDLAAGAYVTPTIFTDCTDDMPHVRDEIFGPVLSILKFSSEAEAITRANKTDYGLAAGVFTNDLTTAHRVASALECGICWVNNYNIYPIELPVGGHKQSGIGYENGMETLRQYTRLKTVYVELGDVDSPYESN